VRVAGEQGIDGAFGHLFDASSDGVDVTRPDRAIVYWSAALGRAAVGTCGVQSRARHESETRGSGSGQ
jgi:hypothetical protein